MECFCGQVVKHMEDWANHFLKQHEYLLLHRDVIHKHNYYSRTGHCYFCDYQPEKPIFRRIHILIEHENKKAIPKNKVPKSKLFK